MSQVVSDLAAVPRLAKNVVVTSIGAFVEAKGALGLPPKFLCGDELAGLGDETSRVLAVGQSAFMQARETTLSRGRRN